MLMEAPVDCQLQTTRTLRQTHDDEATINKRVLTERVHVKLRSGRPRKTFIGLQGMHLTGKDLREGLPDSNCHLFYKILGEKFANEQTFL